MESMSFHVQEHIFSFVTARDIATYSAINRMIRARLTDERYWSDKGRRDLYVSGIETAEQYYIIQEKLSRLREVDIDCRIGVKWKSRTWRAIVRSGQKGKGPVSSALSKHILSARYRVSTFWKLIHGPPRIQLATAKDVGLTYVLYIYIYTSSNLELARYIDFLTMLICDLDMKPRDILHSPSITTYDSIARCSTPELRERFKLLLMKTGLRLH